MYQPTDLKKGVIVQLDGKPYRVVDYNQKVMGRGGSIVNVRLKNLIDGSVLPKTFKGQDKIEPAEVSTQSVQYLYNDGDTFYFMDPTSFEQFELAADLVDSAKDYLKEGDTLSLQFFDGKVINVELPKNLYLQVTYTEDVVKGDTTSSVLKDATLETGLVVKVPAFIKTGDVISVDTASGEYRERKKQCPESSWEPLSSRLPAKVRYGRDSTHTPRKAVYFLCRVMFRLEYPRDVIKTT